MCENENKQDNLVEESQEDIILEETTILPFNPNWLFLIAGILGGLGFVLLSKKDWRA